MILEVKKKKPKISYEFLCSHFGVSKASFFERKKHKDHGLPSLVKKSKVMEHMVDFFERSDETYGSPRLHDDLKEIGITVSENTVAKYMVELGLDARQKKKYRVMTTDSNHSHPIAPRLFKTEDEHCLPTKPGQVLAGDINLFEALKAPPRVSCSGDGLVQQRDCWLVCERLTGEYNCIRCFRNCDEKHVARC